MQLKYVLILNVTTMNKNADQPELMCFLNRNYNYVITTFWAGKEQIIIIFKLINN